MRLFFFRGEGFLFFIYFVFYSPSSLFTVCLCWCCYHLLRLFEGRKESRSSRFLARANEWSDMIRSSSVIRRSPFRRPTAPTLVERLPYCDRRLIASVVGTRCKPVDSPTPFTLQLVRVGSISLSLSFALQSLPSRWQSPVSYRFRYTWSVTEGLCRNKSPSATLCLIVDNSVLSLIFLSLLRHFRKSRWCSGRHGHVALKQTQSLWRVSCHLSFSWLKFCPVVKPKR